MTDRELFEKAPPCLEYCERTSMEREQIIRMAREAGLTEFGGFTEQNIERFFALVAAAEREACAELCERMARRTEDIRRAALEMAAENIRARGNA